MDFSQVSNMPLLSLYYIKHDVVHLFLQRHAYDWKAAERVDES